MLRKLKLNKKIGIKLNTRLTIKNAFKISNVVFYKDDSIDNITY